MNERDKITMVINDINSYNNKVIANMRKQFLISLIFFKLGWSKFKELKHSILQ